MSRRAGLLPVPSSTPARLTDRLRQLEAAGVVARDAPSVGREVWTAIGEFARVFAADLRR